MSQTSKKVIYSGMSMIEGWPEKIQEAQHITTCVANDKEVSRVRMGTSQKIGAQTVSPATIAARLRARSMSRAATSNVVQAAADNGSIATASLAKTRMNDA